jgi:hypothetical protein
MAPKNHAVSRRARGLGVGPLPFPEPDLSDIVDHWPHFDSQWYKANYADVARGNIGPARHFQRFGQWMQRGISAEQPNAALCQDLILALRRAPDISYCIPIMNRSDDIRTSLPENLAENRSFADRLEFLVIFFDDDQDTHEWIRDEFAADIKSGYLRVIISRELKSWHFGRAKNAFRGRMSGKVYSSLDGDNFVTREETEQLLSVAQRHGRRFVLHHFSGSWGDGTSGRVSVPRELYESVGYDPHALPRQYDEIDLIISILIRHPSTRLLRYDSSTHCLSTEISARFSSEAGIDLRPHHIIEQVRRRKPQNPRGEAYLKENPEWMAMTKFNQLHCYCKNLPQGQTRNRYLREIHKARHEVIDAFPRNRLIPALISAQTERQLPEVQQSETSLFCCVKNDEVFLEEFYRHYKRLGIRHFFIIDDRSDIPVCESLPYPDVHVFQPEAGSFATAKGMWIEALMKRFLEPGMWALIVDADEFLDIEPHFDSVEQLVASASAQSLDFLPALLLDMVPDEASAPTAAEDARISFSMRFPDHCLFPGPPARDYVSHASISWGFGEYAALSWAFDARFHAFNTFDSLRKIPLIRVRPGMHINQGFHDLHFTDGSRRIGTEFWAKDLVFPLRHYKITKLFSQHLRVAAIKHRLNYHHRTAENIATIFRGDDADTISSLLSLPRQKYTPQAFRAAVLERRLPLVGV